MAEKIDIYDWEKKLKSVLRRLDDSDIIQKNKELILDFHKQQIAEGIGVGRRAKIIQVLWVLSKNIKKSFDTLDKDDIIDLVGFIETQKWSAWTKHDYKVILRKFFKWLRNSKDYPDEVSWIKASYPKNTLRANQLLTGEDIKRMVEVATNPRDKAFIFILYESGCRIGELLTVRIKDVEFDEYGAFLNVTGKTGPRRVRIIKSVPLLTIWLNCHKYSKNPNAPLWIRLNNPEMKFMATPTVRSFLKKVVRKAGIEKRVHPHLFRHSRATHLASQIPESLLKKHMGWSVSVV
ncbi:MAG: site-specific integrase [Candidatus Bathyarchaeota archaeon]|nr:site-specific integrase [Candidatus Bathyarchaeota archaeon]MDH5595378.1 site-specific integrase [Candidatus Bathyarchaeota archaeon]